VNVYRFIVQPRQAGDPRSKGLLADAHALGFHQIEQIVCHDLYFVEGILSEEDQIKLAERLLSDPITQKVESGCLGGHDDAVWSPTDPGRMLEVTLRAGVTDPVAEQIVRAARVLHIQGVKRASTGLRFFVKANNLSESDLDLLARQLLSNAVIQRYTPGEIEPSFPSEAEAVAHVETLPIRGKSAEELLALSKERRAALDLVEMQAVQAYCQEEERDLSDIEFEMIAQTWSEHCVHKTFKANVQIENYDQLDEGLKAKYPSGKVNNVMRTFLKAATETINAPWVRSAFVDNAGIIEFDGENEISFKVETHNHPSAIEPFGGANTGVGGVIRDVIGVSAKPIAATDVLCFGPQDLPFDQLPEGVLHPRRIFSGVVGGVQDYGNKIGIPTVNGAILFDRGFTSNPLVFCGCVGIAPVGRHVNQPEAGDRVIVIGGRTGRDGLRGATFSSMTMDAQTGEVSGASVQIGAPITEKGLIEVTVRARDEGLYTAITDCGAGGLSSAVGEMTSTIGGDVDLIDVRLKYPGLAPWEIWLSEAQERMVYAVPPANLARFRELCELFDVEFTDIGQFEETGRLVVRYDGKVVLNLSNQFLHEGIPQRKLKAVIPTSAAGRVSQPETPADWNQVLSALLSHPNIASKQAVVRIYDHEVQGGTLVKPLTGAENDGPSDASVLRPLSTRGEMAIALGNGINPEYGKLDAYRMTASVIDEAIRNVVAVGADPQRIAILDNFCWGDPLRPETLGSLLEAARSCYETAVLFGTPFISGKDSFNNEYLAADGLRHSIPPTLLISSIGVMNDLRKAVTMDLKEAGNVIYRVGAFDPRLGASHYRLVTGEAQVLDGEVPALWSGNPQVYQALYRAMQAKLVRACHDLSEGGLAVTAAEMCIGGRLGMEISLEGTDLPAAAEAVSAVFGETNGCLLVEVKQGSENEFEALFKDLPHRRMGSVQGDPRLKMVQDEKVLIEMPVERLVAAWQRKEVD
jgi:phosphoribosylformylglycinamidine synthase subunit PurSL